MRVYHRNATIFAGIFTLIQGAIWAFIAVYSLGVYGCTFDFPFYDDNQTTVGDLLYFAYFIGNCRFSDLGQVPPPLLNLVHPRRTYILMIIYGILSAVWIPSSVLILVISVNKIHGKTGSRCYWPWIITTGALLLLDIGATVIYSVDIANSMATKDYADHFNYPYSLKGMDGLTVIPAVLMTALSCRAVIIYLINLVIFGVVIQASIALRSLSPAAAFVENDARIAPTKGYGGKTSSWVRMSRKPGGVFETSTTMRVEELDLPRLPERPPLSFQTVEKKPERPNVLTHEGVSRPPRPALKPLPISDTHPPPTGINSPTSPFYDVYGKPTTPDSPQPVFVRTRNTLSEGIDNSIPWSYMSPQQAPPKSIPEPDYTIHPKRSSPPTILMSSEEAASPSLMIRSEGVNKNIPWSYMNPQQPLPKHIPEPDYTIRQKKSNPSSNNTSDEGDYPPAKRFENNPNVWKVM